MGDIGESLAELHMPATSGIQEAIPGAEVFPDERLVQGVVKFAARIILLEELPALCTIV
jgi:hypothetical protein